MRGKVDEFITSFAGSLLNYEERHSAERRLLTEDTHRLPWLTTVAKIASREIHICCIPVSDLAAKYLKYELEKIRDSTHQATTWGGQRHWWLTDGATQVTGADRVQRVVTEIIRSETSTYAFDSTSRCKVPKHQKQHDFSLFRTLAQDFVPPRAKEEDIANNKSGHAMAGASRKIGVIATRDTIHAAGRKMFDMSISGAARDKLANGRREVHGVKDLQHPNPGGWHTPGAVYTFVDQDMYIDDFAEYAGEDMCIITPDYDKLAGFGTDSVWYYTINARGEVVVTERVSGVCGATYTNQRPWNYTENDFVYIEHLGKAAFTTYNIAIQYQEGSHHKWVWLARNTTTKISKSICDMMHTVATGAPMDGVPLKKANNVVIVKGNQQNKSSHSNTYLVGMFGDINCPTYSIKDAYDQGPDTSVELTENQFKVFNLMGANRPKGYGVSEVKRTLQMHSIWRAGGIEPLLVTFFGIPVEYRPRPNIMYTRRDGSPDDGETAEHGNAVQAAPAVFGGGPGVADTKSEAAHDAYRTERFEKFQNTVDPPSGFKVVAEMLLDNFIRQVSGETGITKGSAMLCGREKIYQRRTAALQAARLQRHVELLAHLPMPKVNLKSEVLPKAGAAPRAVTQYNEEMAIQTGRLGLMIKEILKDCKFYMPGSSPHEIALAIRNVADAALIAQSDTKGSEVSGAHDTDYTKMDETYSEFIYGLFVKFVLAFVQHDDYDEVSEVLSSNVGIKAMLFGKLLSTGFKNNSGSGVTTELNTITAAFIEYMITCFAITRYMYRSRHGEELDFSTISKSAVRTALGWYTKTTELSHIYWGEFMFQDNRPDYWSVPYAVIGPKFGDDGVGAHLPKITDSDWDAAAAFVTETIGMKLKVSFSRPEDGTFFLGRYYPQPLATLASYADVARACRKISIARNTNRVKYEFKLHGYWTTDSKTPGIREYLIAVARIYGIDLRKYEGIMEVDDDDKPVLSKDMYRLLVNDKDMFYRVAGGPYEVTDEDVPLMLEAIAPQLNFGTTSEFKAWLQAMEKCATWEELDAFMCPQTDFDPDSEPENTVRMSGPIATLLDDQLPYGVDDLVTAADQAQAELIELREETASDSAPEA
jgi:hypothetical protein